MKINPYCLLRLASAFGTDGLACDEELAPSADPSVI